MLDLSIIIPYHNNKSQLIRLLESIPESDSLEVLIVDDHSPSPLSSVFHSRAKIVPQFEGKRWAGAARNTGLSLAKGKYVIFADSDDFFVDSAFEVITQSFDDADVTFFKPTSIKYKGGYSSRHLLYQELIDSFINGKNKDILYKFHVPWSKVYRRDYLTREAILFDEVVASNDVMFSLKSSMLCKSYKVVDKCIYCVVESDTSLTKKKSEAVIDSRFDVLSRYNDFLISRDDSNLAAMSGHLKNAMMFGFSKFMYRFFFCIYKGYPIFYDFSHVMRALRYMKIKKRSRK